MVTLGWEETMEKSGGNTFPSSTESALVSSPLLGRLRLNQFPFSICRDRFNLLSVSHRWLSETPSIPGSIGWDAGQTRMVTIAHFQFLSPLPNPAKRDDFYVLNTHWDDRGLLARGESAKVILNEVERLLQEEERRLGSKEFPLVVLLGDLNAPPREEGYQILTGRKYAQASHRDPSRPERGERPEGRPGGIKFLDTRHELEVAGVSSSRVGEGLLHSPFGDLHTFTGFGRDDQKQVIDVVLFLDPTSVNSEVVEEEGEESSWKVKRYGVIPNRFEDGIGGMLISDHRLVVARLFR